MTATTTAKKVTDYDQLYPGRFIKWGEFQGRDVTLTIKDVVLDMLEGEKGEQMRPVISFVETPKQMTPCKTNGICLKAMFGRSVADWIGKKVTFYGDPTVKLGSKAVGGIRVRGAPSLASPVDVEIKLPKRKAFVMTMVPTGKATQTGHAIATRPEATDMESGADAGAQ